MSVGGAPLTKTFPSDNSMSLPSSRGLWLMAALIDVAEWVASENLAYNVETVTFASTFPR